MMEDRNKTSHIYDQNTSEDIFNRIKENYINAIEKLVNLLNELKK